MTSIVFGTRRCRHCKRLTSNRGPQCAWCGQTDRRFARTRNCDGYGCTHRMHPRCPACDVELYAAGVWLFSHGIGECGCGHRQIPTTDTDGP